MVVSSRLINMKSSSNISLCIPLGWQSDWSGYEVGYPDIAVVGYYTYENINVYIDMDTGDIVEMWYDYEEEDSESLQSCYQDTY